MNYFRALLTALRRPNTPSPATCFRQASWNAGRVDEALPRREPNDSVNPPPDPAPRVRLIG